MMRNLVVVWLAPADGDTPPGSTDDEARHRTNRRYAGDGAGANSVEFGRSGHENGKRELGRTNGPASQWA